MSADRPTYDELKKRLVEAEEIIQTLQARQTERTMRQQRDRAQMYLDVAGVIFVALNTKGEVTLINRKGCEIFGYDQEEIIGRNWFDHFLRPNVKDQVRNVFNKLMAGEVEPVEYYENPVLTKGDEERIIAWHNTILTDNEGHITGVLTLGEDVTERKRAEESLQRASRMRNTLLDNLPCIAMVLKKGTREIVVPNERAKKVGAVPGKTCYEACARRKDSCPFCLAPTLWETGQAQCLEVEYEGAYYEGIWLPLSDGLYVHYIFDITEKKKAVETLRRTEEKYRMLFDGAMDAIFVADARTGLLLECNRAATELTGRQKSELIGQSQKMLHPPQEDEAEFSEVFRRHLNERQGETIETQVITKDGRIREVAIKASLIEIDGKKVLLGVFRDITVRKRAEETLRERESFLNTLLDAIPIPVFCKARNGRYVGFNKAFEQFFGATKEQLVGKTMFDISPPELAEIYHAKDNELFENGGAQQYESKVKNAQGIMREVVFNKAVYTDNQGAVGGLIGAILDITEFKQAQKEIENLSKFPSENPSPVLRIRRDGTLFYSNEAALPLLVRLETEVGGIVPPKWCSLIDEAFESATLRILEEEIDGKIFSFVMTPIVDGDYVNLYGRDITVLKKVESELRKSEERFKQVVENAGDWIWEVDAEGLYTYASSVVERLLGYTPEEMVGKKHFYDFFVPDVKEDLKKAAFEAFARKESFRGFVNPNVHKNGSTVIIETSGTPILDEKGNLCGYRGADRDITERIRREEELRRLNKDLVLASRRAGVAEVATDVLHNVGNVLNSINVSAGFIEEKVSNSKVANLKKVIDILVERAGDLGTFLTEDGRGRHIPLYLIEATRVILDEQAAIAERLHSWMKNVEHIKHIIRAQQNYARSGGLETLSGIPEVIADAVEINHAALERYDIHLQYELAELPRIRMDKQRVLQILVNLITNARQALAESKALNKVLIIRGYKHGENTIPIEVADNGVGISKENMPKIFTHGFTTKKRGHGFGLHSSAVAAREMGGSLTAHSNGPGHGATFTLELSHIKSETVTNGNRTS